MVIKRPVKDAGSLTFLIDCRWFGIGGVGRVTEYLLTAWSRDPPPGKFYLWGPAEVRPYLWDRAEYVAAGRPEVLPVLDQLRVRALPGYHAALFLSQVQPIPPKPFVTVFHDTTPVRWGGRPRVRDAKRRYLALVARRAAALITVSEFSRQCISSDLRVTAEKISVVAPPESAGWRERVVGLRTTTEQEKVALYVGRFGRNKNLPRLIRAFGESEFSRSGGVLKLVGGESAEVAPAQRYVSACGLDRQVEVAGVVSEDQLMRLYAAARFVVAPSYEEGHGLPAREALAAGIPICVSTGGALAELSPHAAAAFDPYDQFAMRQAIDAAASRPFIPKPYSSEESIASFGNKIFEILVTTASVSLTHTGSTR